MLLYGKSAALSSAFLKFFAETGKETHFRGSFCGPLDSVILIVLFAYTGNQKKQRRAKRRNCNDVPGYDKDQYIDPAILANVKGGSYAYCDADGNYYRSGFGLNY